MNELHSIPSKDCGASSSIRSRDSSPVLRGPAFLLIVLPWPVIYLGESGETSPLVALVCLGLSVVWGVLLLRALVEHLVSDFDQWASSTGRELGRVHAIIKRGR